MISAGLQCQLKKFFRKSEGATAIEYGLIAALIALVIVGALIGTGNNIAVMYNRTMVTISNAIANN